MRGAAERSAPPPAPGARSGAVALACTVVAAVVALPAPGLPAEPGTIQTAAGTGWQGSGGDGGPAKDASLNDPVAAAVGPDGSVYVAESGGSRVRRVLPSGVISTIAGNGVRGFSGDGGPATEASLSDPVGVAVGAGGEVYVTDSSNHRVRAIDPAGTITTIAGSGDPGYGGDGGPGAAARLAYPAGLAVAPNGDLLIADRHNHRIRRLDASGTITTVAGDGTPGFSGDGGPATSAALDHPHDVAVGPGGELFITDHLNHRVRMVDPSGTITTVAGNGLWSGGGGNAPQGVPGWILGDGGPATEAFLFSPLGLEIDLHGTLYVADTYNNRIRRVDPSGTITTVAGSGWRGYSGDGGPATRAALYYPHDVALDLDGALLIPELGNDRVRRVTSPFPPDQALLPHPPPAPL